MSKFKGNGNNTSMKLGTRDKEFNVYEQLVTIPIAVEAASEVKKYALESKKIKELLASRNKEKDWDTNLDPAMLALAGVNKYQRGIDRDSKPNAVRGAW